MVGARLERAVDRFYKSIGAQVLDEWKICRLSGAALEHFARQGAAT